MKIRRPQVTLGRTLALIAAAALAMSLCRTPGGRESVTMGTGVMAYFWLATLFILGPIQRQNR